MRLFDLSGSSITVAEALTRGKNNFDLFRLIAALLVIYGHSFAIAPEPNSQDFLFKLTGYYSAAIAVKFFFFLSGILVTDSLLKRRSVIQFLIARFFRIWPALGFVLILSAFVIGPLVTSLDVGSYFSNSNVYSFIKHQLFMESWGTQGLGYYYLPGVFTEGTYKDNVNASLWSLVAEVYAYLFLAAAFLLGLTQRKLAVALFALIILDSVLPSRIIFTLLPQGNEDFSYLPFCFASGAFLALYKDQIRIDIGVPLACLLLFYLLHGTPSERYFFYLTIFTGIFYFATRSWVINNLYPPMDVSYGAFLWGFPIQQTLAYSFPSVNGSSHYLIAMCIAIVMGGAVGLSLKKGLSNWANEYLNALQQLQIINRKFFNNCRIFNWRMK